MRPYAGPLDWMASYDLKDVNRLLENRFKGFMDHDHLIVENMASDKLYFMRIVTTFFPIMIFSPIKIHPLI